MGIGTLTGHTELHRHRCSYVALVSSHSVVGGRSATNYESIMQINALGQSVSARAVDEKILAWLKVKDNLKMVYERDEQ